MSIMCPRSIVAIAPDLKQSFKSAKPWYYANLKGGGRECNSRRGLYVQ